MSSCVDTVILPENKTLDEDFWQKKDEVQSVVATAYAQLRDGGANAGSVSFQRNIIIWSDFRSDEMEISSEFQGKTNAIVDALKEIYSLQIQPDNTFTTWYPLYSAINYCNLVLEKGEQTKLVDPDYTEGDWLANKAQVTALKSLCYFYLVRVFRDIPVTPHAYLNSSDDLEAEQKAPAEVLEMCIKDLESVRGYAPDGDAFGDARDFAYFNKDGINALLADIYLWRASVNHDENDYKKCVEYCEEVIKAKKKAHKFDRFEIPDETIPYFLEPANLMYEKIFGFNGQNDRDESIFEIQYKASSNTNNALASLYYGASSNTTGYGYVKATKNYGMLASGAGSANVFKTDGDWRFFESCYDANAATETGQYAIRKMIAHNSVGSLKAEAFKAQNIAQQHNWIVYRLTDVMLMEAEALVQLDKIDDAFAIVKFVNDRAIANDASKELSKSTYQDKMEDLVLLERARELCFEGKRWFDLLRYNYRHVNGVDYTKKLSELNGNFVANSEEFFEIVLNKYTATKAMKAKMPSEPYLYMPLNESELKNNSKLIQNPVYKSSTK